LITQLKDVKNLFIEGTPGVGKTSLIKEVISPYGGRAGGFYTEDIRVNTVREGFRLCTLNGQKGILASKSIKSFHKLGKYHVDLDIMEKLAVPALQRALNESELIVIDEIGSMEVMCENFRKLLMEGLNAPQNLLATVRAGSHPFTDEIKQFPHTHTLVLSRRNYNANRHKVEAWLREALE